MEESSLYVLLITPDITLLLPNLSFTIASPGQLSRQHQSAAIKKEAFCAFTSRPAPLISNILFDLLSLIS